MITKKIVELYFKKNDIYILDVHQNKIIVNDDYYGLLHLKFSLDIEKRIPIDEGTTIYFLYKEFEGNDLFIYSPDQERMTFVSATNNKNSFIILLRLLEECIFSPIYYWKNDILILTTYNHICYQVCFLTDTLKEISSDEVKKIDITFYNFWNESKNYNVIKSYSEQFSFIFQEDDKTVGFCNVKNNKKIVIQSPNNGWHDVEHCDNVFIFVYEKKLIIIHNNTQTSLQPNSEYIFLRAKFLSNNTIVVLSSKPSNSQESILEVYTLND